MKRKRILYGIWLVLACCLYFFENGTGTRIVLVCSIALPFLPILRQAWFRPDPGFSGPVEAVKTLSSAEGDRDASGSEEEPWEIRIYQPGDPVRLIHWKLSARRDELLVREPEKVPADPVPARRNVPAKGIGSRPSRRTRLLLSCLALALVLLAFLLLVPSLRLGAQVLANRLFEESERLNAYAYRHFEIDGRSDPVAAACLLSAVLLILLFLTAAGGSLKAALALMAACVLFQVYFGLPFPGWLNVLLFALFALRFCGIPPVRRTALALAEGILLLSLIVLLVWPGTEPLTESASESVRDWLSQASRPIAGAVSGLPEEENEARHVHTRSLTEGTEESRPEKDYRLVTVEEEQISMPHWINWLKMVLLLLLAAASLILPFLPFLLLNARRKRALEKRRLFGSPDVGEAVCAAFQLVISWLDATGNGAGNLPYRCWTGPWPEFFPEGYGLRFSQCAAHFEEAAYSGHPLREEQRQQTLELLEETERVLWEKAGWKLKFRLKYLECLRV